MYGHSHCPDNNGLTPHNHKLIIITILYIKCYITFGDIVLRITVQTHYWKKANPTRASCQYTMVQLVCAMPRRKMKKPLQPNHQSANKQMRSDLSPRNLMRNAQITCQLTVMATEIDRLYPCNQGNYCKHILLCVSG